MQKIESIIELDGPTRSDGVSPQIGDCTRSKLNRTARGMMAQVPSFAQLYSTLYPTSDLRPTISPICDKP